VNVTHQTAFTVYLHYHQCHKWSL